MTNISPCKQPLLLDSMTVLGFTWKIIYAVMVDLIRGASRSIVISGGVNVNDILLPFQASGDYC